jgi:hypothetical protein
MTMLITSYDTGTRTNTALRGWSDSQMEAPLVRETLRSIREDEEFVYSCTRTLGAIRMDHEADGPHLPRWAALPL